MSDLSRAITLMISGMLAFSIGDLFPEIIYTKLAGWSGYDFAGCGDGPYFCGDARQQNRPIFSPDARHPYRDYALYW